MIEKKKREYFPESFTGEDGEELKSYLQEMLSLPISSPEGLVQLIYKYGELSDILEEVGAWKTIRMTQHADDPDLAKAQADFFESAMAPAQPLFDKLDRKIYESEFFPQLPQERYGHLGRLLKNEIDLFREENVPLFVKENALVSKYGEMYSQLTVQFEGEEKTLTEMDIVLRDNDRKRREKAWRLISDKLLEKKEDFDKLFDELKTIRVLIAHNADFDNYRDYMHKASGRFDYSVEDIMEFHDSVRKAVLPALRDINERRRRTLKVKTLRPWDMAVALDGKVLHPFSDESELLMGTIRVLSRLDPEFADIIREMSENSLLDLPNRKGKAHDGYSCSLPETGSSFIFMKSIGIQRDVQTLLHESGHSIHSLMTRNEKIAAYRELPMEVNEMASQSMELFMLDCLDEFYAETEEVMKAKREQLEDVLSVFPAVAVIDAFQHWIYLHPECGAAERDAEFARLKDAYDAGVDWSGLDAEKANSWIRVLHIFEVPFYYIEYALSQLGAIAIYKNYKENPRRAVGKYKEFLKLGYSKPVPEIYAAAGIRFDFSKAYLQEMVDFIMAEIGQLEDGSRNDQDGA